MEGKGELSLLANLLGTTSPPASGTLKIDLFNDHYLDMEPAKDASSAPLTKSESGGIRIDVKRGDRSTLLNIANVSKKHLLEYRCGGGPGGGLKPVFMSDLGKKG